MNIIKVLPPEEAKKIAAGEIVERPASVVKELFENSIDADSTQISIYIENAGKKLIRVVDNGCGMSHEDAKTCFDNHATSKIKSLKDLEQISTFGFRGEALASISSVSQVNLTTKKKDTVGISIEYENGNFVSKKEIACADGTDLQIKNLFYNVPVRQKFLKHDETEWNKIQNLFYAISLSNLKIHFKLFHNGNMVSNLPIAKNIAERTTQIWGHETSENLVPISGERTGLRITGLISNHNFWRYGRHSIFFFVNNRWIKNSELSKALMKGYRNVLPPARFPSSILFIETDKDLVDINFHPRKEEVRFSKPGVVEKLIETSVSETLNQIISNQLSSKDPFKQPVVAKAMPGSPSDKISLDNRPFERPFDAAQKRFAQGERYYDLPEETYNLRQKAELFNRVENNISPFALSKVSIGTASKGCSNGKPQKNENIAPENNRFKIIGQLLKTYIVIENDEGLLLIDQHAAHERILYEKYLKNFEQKDGIALLFPEIIRMSEHQIDLVIKQKTFFGRQGIEIEKIGPTELALKTSPPKIESQSLKELIFEVIEFVEENEGLEEEVFRKKLNEHMHGQIACKMAIKAGDELTPETMTSLISDLQQVDNRFICVHGRPTTWKMTKTEIEKCFRRR